MYNKALEIWQSYACPHGHTGGFYVLHLTISLIGVTVGVVCSVLFIKDGNEDGTVYAVWAVFSTILAAVLAFTHITARYIPDLVPPERLGLIAIIGGMGSAAGLIGIFYHLGHAIFMTSLVRSEIILVAWAIITFTWGISLTAFAGYYRSQTEECRPIMQQQRQRQQQEHDDLRVGNMV